MSQPDVRALMRHVMQEKTKQQMRFLENAVLAASDARIVAAPAADGNVCMTETRIYIGLNDAETREQKHETEKYLGILKDVCRNYHVAFSVDIEEGGYYHEDGQYTEETSLVLVLIDADPDAVRAIAEDLRVFFRQESVLVTENRVNGYFVSESPSEGTGAVPALQKEETDHG